MEWISVKDRPSAKDKPILVWAKFVDFPVSVLWKENGAYGEPDFFESGDEYAISEERISHWMPLPKPPEGWWKRAYMDEMGKMEWMKANECRE